ncbi:MAG: BMP family ABC transporter substrate-binding protein [Nocardioidaceae bacterium]|nr:BMP family ABC transporter substrate-binding protein [Nocardioidaceae bacterium]
MRVGPFRGSNRRLRGLVALVAAGVLTLSACGGSGDSEKSGAKKDGLKAVLIVNQKPGDGGPIDLMISALNEGKKTYGYAEVKDAYVADPSQAEQAIRQFANNGYDLIMTTFSPSQQATGKVAEESPKVKFVNILGDPAFKNPENMASFFTDDVKGGYLMGVLAGMKTKTGKVAFMCGPRYALSDRVLAGMIQGARSVNPSVQVKDAYTESYDDAAGGKQIADFLYDSGVDVIASMAAGAEAGIRDAAEEDPGSRQVITSNAAPAPGSPESKIVLGSISPGLAASITNALKLVADGTFQGGEYLVPIKDGSYLMGGLAASVSAEEKARLDTALADLGADKITLQGGEDVKSLLKNGS